VAVPVASRSPQNTVTRRPVASNKAAQPVVNTNAKRRPQNMRQQQPSFSNLLFQTVVQAASREIIKDTVKAVDGDIDSAFNSF